MFLLFLDGISYINPQFDSLTGLYEFDAQIPPNQADLIAVQRFSNQLINHPTNEMTQGETQYSIEDEHTLFETQRDIDFEQTEIFSSPSVEKDDKQVEEVKDSFPNLFFAGYTQCSQELASQETLHSEALSTDIPLETQLETNHSNNQDQIFYPPEISSTLIDSQKESSPNNLTQSSQSQQNQTLFTSINNNSQTFTYDQLDFDPSSYFGKKVVNKINNEFRNGEVFNYIQ